MQIEFTCPNCRRLLRVDATAAGKRARCPDCSAVTEVPRASIPSKSAGDFAGFGSGNPAESGAAPWSTSNWKREPYSVGDDSAANPFSAPESDYAGLHSFSLEEDARNQLAAPAMCLIVTGSIVFVLSAIPVALMLFTATVDAVRMFPQEPFEAIVGVVIVVGMSVIGVGRPALVVYGGIKMKKLQRYPFAIVAAILAVISFCSCFLELIFGIWALLVLSRPRVKQAFDEQKFKTFEQRPF